MSKTFKTTDKEETLIVNNHMKSKTLTSNKKNGNKIALRNYFVLTDFKGFKMIIYLG